MKMIQDEIASRLELAFIKHGFTEPGVAKLRDLSGVSLRTLYKYYPSKEEMVIGALDHRHRRYLEFLAKGEPAPGRDSIRHLFKRLPLWMGKNAPKGCLLLNAIASYPNSQAIHESVNRNKKDIVSLMARRSGVETLATQLFLLHEGACAAWPFSEMAAIQAAETAALKLMDCF